MKKQDGLPKKKNTRPGADDGMMWNGGRRGWLGGCQRFKGGKPQSQGGRSKGLHALSKSSDSTMKE